MLIIGTYAVTVMHKAMYAATFKYPLVMVFVRTSSLCSTESEN